MENKKIILANTLGYVPTMYPDIFKIPCTDMYIHIDNKLIITPTFKMENKLEETNIQYYNKLTIEDIEKALASMSNNPFDYPKDCGNGLYEISKGCFTGHRGLYEFNKELRNIT